MAERNLTRHLVGAMAVLALLLPAMPVIAADPQFPAIVDPPSAERHAGKVIFVELVTTDLTAAKQFYGDLFGWTFRDVDLGNAMYAEVLHRGRPIAGMIQRSSSSVERRQPAWLSFLSANDVDAVQRTAVQRGARLLFGPQTIPGRGREAVFADPQGAVFAVLNSSSGDPPDVLVEPGEWIWSSLITRDPDTAASFYQALFGYEVFDLPSQQASNAEHLLLASDNYARASANPLPASKPDLHPHWLNFVRVDDATQTAAKVAALGGRVLVPAREDRHGGKLAVVADPQGAPFGLLEWSQTTPREVRR
jgi:uncharacterized protein